MPNRREEHNSQNGGQGTTTILIDLTDAEERSLKLVEANLSDAVALGATGRPEIALALISLASQTMGGGGIAGHLNAGANQCAPRPSY